MDRLKKWHLFGILAAVCLAAAVDTLRPEKLLQGLVDLAFMIAGVVCATLAREESEAGTYTFDICDRCGAALPVGEVKRHTDWHDQHSDSLALMGTVD